MVVNTVISGDVASDEGVVTFEVVDDPIFDIFIPNELITGLLVVASVVDDPVLSNLDAVAIAIVVVAVGTLDSVMFDEFILDAVVLGFVVADDADFVPILVIDSEIESV